MESDSWPRLFAQMHFGSDTTWRTCDLVTFSHIMDLGDQIEWRVQQKHRFDFVSDTTWKTLSHFWDLEHQIEWRVQQKLGFQHINWQKTGIWRFPLHWPYPFLMFICRPRERWVGMVHPDFCNVTFHKKLRDRWFKLELPDLSLLNSHIWRRYFPSQQFQIDFSVFAAQAPVFNDGCVSVSWAGGKKVIIYLDLTPRIAQLMPN